MPHIQEALHCREQKAAFALNANESRDKNSAIEEPFSAKHWLPLISLIAFLVPLKLAPLYAVLLPVIILWAYEVRGRLLPLTIPAPEFYKPYFLFVAAAAITSLFGIDRGKSLAHVPTLLLYGLTALMFHSVCQGNGKRIRAVLLALLTGQFLAGLHSILEGAYPGIGRLFLGKVSESGQLSLSVLVAATFVTQALNRSAIKAKHESLLLCSALALATGGAAVFAFQNSLTHTAAVPGAALALGLALVLGLVYVRKAEFSVAAEHFIVLIVFPVLLAALLVNLKRGPWLGVTAGAALLMSLRARVLLVPTLLAIAALFAFFDPIRERLLVSTQHFFIAGGRSAMWEIGLELCAKFPLGIGLDNSSILRFYSTEIPPEHRHFHNNILNLVVELGWIPAVLFVWWFVKLLARAFKKPKDPFTMENSLAVGIGCALLSWQCAGLVEYNLGDSEVVFAAFILIGILAAVTPGEEPRKAETFPR